jgi:hypothetical protein
VPSELFNPRSPKALVTKQLYMFKNNTPVILREEKEDNMITFN